MGGGVCWGVKVVERTWGPLWKEALTREACVTDEDNWGPVGMGGDDTRLPGRVDFSNNISP